MGSIICTNVAPFWKHDNVSKLFAQSGVITNIHMEPHATNGGIVSFVTFQNIQMAKNACKHFHGHCALKNIPNCPRMIVELVQDQRLNCTDLISNKSIRLKQLVFKKNIYPSSDIFSSVDLIQNLRKQIFNMHSKLITVKSNNSILKHQQMIKENDLKKKLEGLNKKVVIQKKIISESTKQQNQLIKKLQDTQTQYLNLKKVKDNLQELLINSETEIANEKLLKKKLILSEANLKILKVEVERWKKIRDFKGKEFTELKKKSEITKKTLSLREIDWDNLKKKYNEKKKIIDKLKMKISNLRFGKKNYNELFKVRKRK